MRASAVSMRFGGHGGREYKHFSLRISPFSSQSMASFVVLFFAFIVVYSGGGVLTVTDECYQLQDLGRLSYRGNNAIADGEKECIMWSHLCSVGIAEKIPGIKTTSECTSWTLLIAAAESEVLGDAATVNFFGCRNPKQLPSGPGCFTNIGWTSCYEKVPPCVTACDPVHEKCTKVDKSANCSANATSYVCECSLGYEGADCQTNINQCEPSPCQNGADCVEVEETFSVRCECPPGFSGELCQTDIDECQSRPCQNGATCIDKVNGYHCECNSGFTGQHCSIDVNECLESPCGNGGTCINEQPGFRCDCVAGWEGTLCLDETNECANQPCLNGATCVDQFNAFSCQCAGGFEGDTCATNVDDCPKISCQNGGTCVDEIMTAKCSCTAGFGGTFCETDLCTTMPCKNGGTCEPDETFGYSCRCATGYTGVNCTINIDDCSPNPCANGGTCSDGVDNYTCACRNGFFGSSCESDKDHCSDKPCRNGGTCRNMGSTFLCSCVQGYYGTRCENRFGNCDGNPCQNGGTCIDGLNYRCGCPEGLIGDNCEEVADIELFNSFLETQCYETRCNGENPQCISDNLERPVKYKYCTRPEDGFCALKRFQTVDTNNAFIEYWEASCQPKNACQRTLILAGDSVEDTRICCQTALCNASPNTLGALIGSAHSSYYSSFNVIFSSLLFLVL